MLTIHARLMRRCWRTSRIARLSLAVVLLVSGAGARAQTAPAATPIHAPPEASMTMAEYQSLSCAAGGTIGGVAVYIYNEDLAVALTGDISPVLLLPFIAAGFSAGCGIASALAPGLAWLYRHITGPHPTDTAAP